MTVPAVSSNRPSLSQLYEVGSKDPMQYSNFAFQLFTATLVRLDLDYKANLAGTSPSPRKTDIVESHGAKHLVGFYPIYIA